ncbi:hypothetical protein OJJOAM_004384 [Cupriavidus sp. H18C1]
MVVPVAVQQAAVRQPHHAPMRGARAQSFGAVHPERVFRAQMRQVGMRWLQALRLEQFRHQRKHRRLRTAQVVAARAVGHQPVTVEQIGEVVRHRPHQIVAAAGLESQHREIGIPVVQLAEASAGHDIGGEAAAAASTRADGRSDRASAPATGCRYVRAAIRRGWRRSGCPVRCCARNARRRRPPARSREDRAAAGSGPESPRAERAAGNRERSCCPRRCRWPARGRTARHSARPGTAHRHARIPRAGAAAGRAAG